jgi:hypothetical protein
MILFYSNKHPLPKDDLAVVSTFLMVPPVEVAGRV